MIRFPSGIKLSGVSIENFEFLSAFTSMFDLLLFNDETSGEYQS